jgi:hypothetical protein
MIGRFFKEGLISYERKMACQNRNVLLVMGQGTAHNKEGITLNHVHLFTYFQTSPSTCNY